MIDAAIDAVRERVQRIGLSAIEADRKVALVCDAMRALAELRGAPGVELPGLIAHWVPGRVEFLGKHTDYAGGRSLLCAVERGVCVVARARDDARLRVRAAASGETVDLAIDGSPVATTGVMWATYPATVARRLARNFCTRLTGADVAFASDLPIAAGMSSSSALVVAMFLTLSTVNRLAERGEYRREIHTTDDLAEYLGSIENGFDYRGLTGDAGVGTLSGCEDQTAMLGARPGALVQYAFCPVRFERAIRLPAGLVLAVASSGLRAEKTLGALEKYNVLSRRARAVRDVWRAETGSMDATIGDALASSATASADLRRFLDARPVEGFSSVELVERLEQFVEESEVIIPAAGDALARGDLAELGALVDRSVEGAARLLRNQVPETLALTRLAREMGAVAASPFGAGFGGSVWALTKEGQGGGFLEGWKSAYLERFPEWKTSCEFFLTRAGPPACRIA